MSGYDPDAFQEFERTGWNEVAAVYAELVDSFELTSGPAGGAILDAARVGPGQRVLDVATGPGFLAGLALERGATVVGIDIAETMVAIARGRHPAARFEVGAAEDLPVRDRAYDAVVSAWGLPHFADHSTFFTEARRVLKPRGRLSLGTWCPPPGNQFFALLLGALTGHATNSPNLPAGPDMFRYADPNLVERELTTAGFVNVSVSPVDFTVRLDNGAEDLIRFLAAGSVRSRALYLAQPPDTRDRIDANLHEQLATTADGGPTDIELTAVVIAADG